MQPLQDRGDAGGEDPQHVEMARLDGQGPVVEDREQADHVALAIEQRRPQVAFDPQPDERLRLREAVLHAEGMLAQPATHDILTRGAGEVILDILLDLSPRPEGERADARVHAGELGDGGEGHADSRGQMAHQVLKELLARAAGGPLDDGPEDIEVVVDRGRRRSIPTGGSGACPEGVRNVGPGEGGYIVHQRSFKGRIEL